VVHVDTAAVTPSRRSLWAHYAASVLGVAGVILWLVALLLLAAATRNSAAFTRWLPAILIVNAAGSLAMFTLLVRKLVQLWREYRKHVPGSRLKARTVAIFSGLAVAPILVVYYFALQFLDRGIDSWFELEVKQGLTDTRELSRGALDLRVREFLQRTQLVAHEIADVNDIPLLRALDRERRASGALELTVVGPQGRFLATSSGRPMDATPLPASDEMLMQLRHGGSYVSLDTDAAGGYVIRAAAPLDAATELSGSRSLIALYPVPQQLAQLAVTVQRSYTQFAKLMQLRQPLKTTFMLILSFVVLMALLVAVYGALSSAQRLIKPVQDLIAVAR
jgi:nitrogen fixation/metabolism regulation signal transduction histidine kinase